MEDPATHHSSAFADRLSSAMTRRGISIRDVARRLGSVATPVSATTLSYWRTAHRHPEGAASLAAVEQLETILELEPGELVSLIPSSGRVGALRPPTIPRLPDTTDTIVRETLERIGGDPQNQLREASVHLTGDVDADGKLRRSRYRSVIQATSGRVRHIPSVNFVDSEPITHVAISAVAGCRIARRYEHPSGLAVGHLIELDRVLVAPERAVIEIDLNFDPVTYLDHLTQRRVRDLLIWLRFPHGAPASIEQYESDATNEWTTALSPSAASFHLERQGFGPGSVGFRWDG